MPLRSAWMSSLCEAKRVFHLERGYTKLCMCRSRIKDSVIGQKIRECFALRPVCSQEGLCVGSAEGGPGGGREA